MMKPKLSWMLSWMDLLIGDLMLGGELLIEMKLMISERSVRTDISREGTPGTPSKKRVRYADEEQLPLETFKDPSPNRCVPSALDSIGSELMAEYHHHRRRDRNRSCLKLPVAMKGSRSPTSLHIKLRGLTTRTNHLRENRPQWLTMLPKKRMTGMMTLREWYVSSLPWRVMFCAD